MPTPPFGFFRVGAACPPVSVADPEQNVIEILRFVRRAHEGGAQAVVFPELGLTGYTAGDLFFSLSVLVAGAEAALARLLRETSPLSTILIVGLPVEADGRLYNCAAVFQSGRLLRVVAQSFLPRY